LHEAAIAHRHAVRRNEKAICSINTQDLGSVPIGTWPATAAQQAQRTALLNSAASAPGFPSYREPRRQSGAFANLRPDPAAS